MGIARMLYAHTVYVKGSGDQRRLAALRPGFEVIERYKSRLVEALQAPVSLQRLNALI
jgi:hypothetical protein